MNAIWKYYLSRFPWRFFVNLKMGFFSVNKEVFPIGISLCVRIRGTRSDGKLNLIYNYSFQLSNIKSVLSVSNGVL